MDLQKFKNKLVICKDAGAANMIYSNLNNIKYSRYYCYLKGPAKQIFKSKKFIHIRKPINLKNFELIITGTSVDKFELNFISRAKVEGVRSITFLDHWTDYKKRFLLKKKLILPNEIVAFDDHSFKLIKKLLVRQLRKKKLIISINKNNYLKNIGNTINKKNDLLILSSNYDRLNNRYFSDDKIIYNLFKDKISFFKRKNINNFFLKYHPSENTKKFLPLVKRLKYEFDIDLKISNDDLKKIIKKTKFVIGYNSFALVIAKLYRCITFEIKIKNFNSDIPKKYINRYIN